MHGPSMQASMLVEDVLASHLPTSRVPRLHALLAERRPDPYAPLAAPAAADPAAAGAAAVLGDAAALREVSCLGLGGWVPGPA